MLIVLMNCCNKCSIVQERSYTIMISHISTNTEIPHLRNVNCQPLFMVFFSWKRHHNTLLPYHFRACTLWAKKIVSPFFEKIVHVKAQQFHNIFGQFFAYSYLLQQFSHLFHFIIYTILEIPAFPRNGIWKTAIVFSKFSLNKHNQCM